MNQGMTEAQARERIAQDVFGHNYRRDKDGTPIETGIGSATQPSREHLEATQRWGGTPAPAKRRPRKGST
jgi:hypothetical protein